jgi:hypothetical protein
MPFTTPEPTEGSQERIVAIKGADLLLAAVSVVLEDADVTGTGHVSNLTTVPSCEIWKFLERLRRFRSWIYVLWDLLGHWEYLQV